MSNSYSLILGDLHLGGASITGKVGVGSNLNSRLVDQMNLLDWVLDQAIEHQVDDIIITGDVFEEPKPHPTVITLFISWLKKCQAYHVNVRIIVGNHDIFRNGTVTVSPLDIISEVELENVFVYKNINTVLINNTAFTFMPFRDRKSYMVNSGTEAINIIRESLVYELAEIPVTYQKVVVGHLAIEKSIPIGDEIDDVTNELFCPIDLFNGYDYVWMGHVHRPQVMNKFNPYVAHIGSMDISNFGETEHNKIIVILNTINKEPWIEKSIPARQLKKISISIPEDIEDSTDYVISELSKIKNYNKSIIKLDISLTNAELKSVNKSIIEKYIISQGAFSVSGISESKKVSLIKKNNNNVIDTKMDVSSAIKAYADAHVDEKLKSSFIEESLNIYDTFMSEAKS